LYTNLVPDKIEAERQKAISAAIAVVTNAIEKYQSPGFVCVAPDRSGAKFENETRMSCDAMVLGTLIKNAVEIEIWPPPLAPFVNYSWVSVTDTIRSMNVVSGCDSVWAGRSYNAKHNVLLGIVADINLLQCHLAPGLPLDFDPKRRATKESRR
jgi:hypothetical protein